MGPLSVAVIGGGAVGWLVAADGPAVIGGILVLVLLSLIAPRPYLLALLLGAGLAIGGRTFSYLYLQFGWLPLFVTEATVAATVVLAAFRLLLWGRETGLRSAHWTLFSLLMLVLACGMLRDFDPLKTGRHSVVLLYAVFYLAPVVGIRGPKGLWVSATIFVVATTVKSLIYMGDVCGLGMTSAIPLPLRLVGLGTQVDMMWAAVSVIIIATVMPVVNSRARPLCWFSLLSCLWVVVYVESRAMWTGLAFAGVVLSVSMARNNLIRPHHWRNGLILVGLLLLGGAVTAGIRPSWTDSRLAELGTLVGAEVQRSVYRYANVGVRLQLWADMWGEITESWTSLMLGVGFGKPWIPELARVLTSPTFGPLAGGQIFAPHNSQLTVLYRVGFVGFAVYATFILSVALSVWRALRTGPLALRLLVASMLASLAYALFHSLTDVVLESPFRGVIVWLLLGFCQAGANILNRMERAAASSPGISTREADGSGASEVHD